jgi:GAF domain-containing protein
VAERKERILRLRLGNQVRRTSLEVLRQNTITVAECEAAMERISTVMGGEILKLPASLSDQLAGRNPEQIQRMLDTALRSSLERLSQPENYLYSN